MIAFAPAASLACEPPLACEPQLACDPDLAAALADAGLPVKAEYTDDELVRLLLCVVTRDAGAAAVGGSQTADDCVRLSQRLVGYRYGLTRCAINSAERRAFVKIRRALEADGMSLVEEAMA